MNKIRIYFRLTIRPVEDEEQFRLPFPLACLIVSIIWFWVRVSLKMPAGIPLFHDRFWRFGDGLALALGIIGGLLIALWIKDVIIRMISSIKGL